MLDPAGMRRVVFPRLLAIIADMKENCELVCLYGSSRSNRPCMQLNSILTQILLCCNSVT